MTSDDIGTRVFETLNAWLSERTADGIRRGECPEMERDGDTFTASVAWWAQLPVDASGLARVVREAGGCNIWIDLCLWADINDNTGNYGPGGYDVSITFEDRETTSFEYPAAPWSETDPVPEALS